MTNEQQLRKTVQEESTELAQMQQRLHDAGLHETAHAVNAASQTLGWEAERVLTKQEKQSG